MISGADLRYEQLLKLKNAGKLYDLIYRPVL